MFVADTYGWRTKMCFTVNRGEGKTPVPSCEGGCFIGLRFIFMLFSNLQPTSLILMSMYMLFRYWQTHSFLCLCCLGMDKPTYFYVYVV